MNSELFKYRLEIRTLIFQKQIANQGVPDIKVGKAFVLFLLFDLSGVAILSTKHLCLELVEST